MYSKSNSKWTSYLSAPGALCSEWACCWLACIHTWIEVVGGIFKITTRRSLLNFSSRFQKHQAVQDHTKIIQQIQRNTRHWGKYWHAWELFAIQTISNICKHVWCRHSPDVCHVWTDRCGEPPASAHHVQPCKYMQKIEIYILRYITKCGKAPHFQCQKLFNIFDTFFLIFKSVSSGLFFNSTVSRLFHSFCPEPIIISISSYCLKA